MHNSDAACQLRMYAHQISENKLKPLTEWQEGLEAGTGCRTETVAGTVPETSGNLESQDILGYPNLNIS